MRAILPGLCLAAALLAGEASAQARPWVSLAKADLGGCAGEITEYKERWVATVDRARTPKFSTLAAMSPADFMMDVPSDCGDCGDTRMIDEFVEAKYLGTVPWKVTQASKKAPAAPERRNNSRDATVYVGVLRHCLATIWVEKLYAKGMTLEGVKVSADEARYLGITVGGFDRMVRDLNQKYRDGVPPRTPPAPTPTPAPTPPRVTGGTPPAPKPPVVAAPAQPDARLPGWMKECNEQTLDRIRRISACTSAIGGGAKGAELARAHWARSVLRLLTGDIRGSIADADAAALIEPGNSGPQNSRCWSRAVGNRELDVARRACDIGIGLAPSDPNVIDSRGLVNLRQGRWEEAWRDYDAAVRLDNRFASAIYGRGLAALALGRERDAAADFTRALNIDPGVRHDYDSYGVTAVSIRSMRRR